MDQAIRQSATDLVTVEVTRTIWDDLWSWAEDMAVQHDFDFEEAKGRRNKLLVTMPPVVAWDMLDQISYYASPDGPDMIEPYLRAAYRHAERSMLKQAESWPSGA